MTTYGALWSFAGHWIIRCEPQVRTRLKRVFPRMNQAAGETVDLSDTPEHCRDLLWFMERYPLDVSAEDRGRLEDGAARHREMEQRLADLLELRKPPPRVELAEPAREYQLEAGAACSIRGGLLLADEVGVGKTVSGIVPMAAGHLPAVFVCEPHLERQMEAAVNRFLPQLQVHRMRKGTPYPLNVKKPRLGLSAQRLPDVFVLSYHKLRGWANTLAELVRYCVFDECQRLRNDASDIYRAAKYLASKAQMSMGLSATPIYNYGNEFFWVIDALLPGVLGSRNEFIREWCTEGGDKARIKDTNDFGSYLRREGIMLRRTRKDVRRELPYEAQRIPHHVDSDPKLIESMTGDAAKLAQIILDHNERFRGEHMKAAGELDMIMRQATGIAKAPYVAEFVRLLLESGEKVIVYAWHREVYRILQSHLREYEPLMYTGSESPAGKALAAQEFMHNERRRVMFMSLRAGAGVDGLQKSCSTVAFAELDWSPGVHDQCVGRVDRDGQERPVVAYFLVSDEGSDPIVSEVCGIKVEQREGVISPNAPLVQRIEGGEDHIRRLAKLVLERHSEGFAARYAARQRSEMEATL